MTQEVNQRILQFYIIHTVLPQGRQSVKELFENVIHSIPGGTVVGVLT